MKYVLAVKSPVYGAEGAFLAYQFAQALLEKGHQISQIFFFQDGVSNGNRLTAPASDELNLNECWATFAKEQNVPLHLCISAAARRGVVEQNLAEPFALAGLGEFSKAVFESDRLMTF